MPLGFCFLIIWFFSLQVATQQLISGNRYEGKEDFAVVLQPFLQNFFIPQVGVSHEHPDQMSPDKRRLPVLTLWFLHQVGEADPSFFSVNCYHFSERAQAEMAIGLWNNMVRRKRILPTAAQCVQNVSSSSLTCRVLSYQLEPVGQKQAYNNFTYNRFKIQCPSEVRVKTDAYVSE